MKALNPLVGEIERDERSTSLTKLYLLTSQDFVGQPYCPPLIEIRRVRGTLTEAPPGIRQLCRRPRGDSQASVCRPPKFSIFKNISSNIGVFHKIL